MISVKPVYDNVKRVFYKDIDEVCKKENLKEFLQDEFITSVWGIRRK